MVVRLVVEWQAGVRQFLVRRGMGRLARVWQVRWVREQLATQPRVVKQWILELAGV